MDSKATLGKLPLPFLSCDKTDANINGTGSKGCLSKGKHVYIPFTFSLYRSGMHAPHSTCFRKQRLVLLPPFTSPPVEKYAPC